VEWEKVEDYREELKKLREFYEVKKKDILYQ
jgi:hypothetical protein